MILDLSVFVVQIPHVNVMSKLDLLNKEAKSKLERYLDPDMATVLAEEMADDDEQLASRFQKLNHALASLVCDMIIFMIWYDMMNDFQWKTGQLAASLIYHIN